MNMSRLTIAALFSLSVLTLSACGGNTASSSPQENGDGIVLPEGFEDGIVYQKNDMTVKITEYFQSDTLHVVDCDITNNGSEAVEFKMLPLLINGEVTADGYFTEVKPSATEKMDFYIDLDILNFAGLKEIRTIDTWVSIKKEAEESYSEPELIRLVQNNPDQGDPVLQHSQDVLYDEGGIKLSYLGSFVSDNQDNNAVFLVSNDTDKTIRTDTDYNYELVDGKPRGEKGIGCFPPSTPAGRKSLLSIRVHNSEDYSPASFESADTRLLITDDQYNELAAVPVHLTMDNDQILFTPGDSYYQEYQRPGYDVCKLPGANGMDEYLTVFYDKATGTLQGMIDELYLPKSLGVKKEDIESISFEDNYPGFDALDFKEVVFDEDNENIRLIIILRDLNDTANLNALSKTGFLLKGDNYYYEGLSAASLLQAFEEKGAERIDQEDFESLGLHFDLY